MLIGIIGKPSCGKSTFFKASTLAEVEIANYPFTTIEPNRAFAFVKIKDVAREFNKIANPREGFVLKYYRFYPVEMMDVAGLVPGAHKGYGRGNKFLDDLRQADVFIHIIDVSGSVNEKGEPVEPLSYDPAKDVSFLEHELDMWYLRLVNKGWDKFVRQVKQEKQNLYKAIAKQLSGLGVTEEIAEEIIKEFPEDILAWGEEELVKLATLLRKKTKPMIIAANKIDVKGADKNFESLKKEFKDYMIIPCSAESELALREAAKSNLIGYIPGENCFKILEKDKLSEKQLKALDFIQKNILDKYGCTGVQDVLNKAVFDLLNYIAVHPGGVSKLEDSKGNVLPDCFLMKKGSTALDFAFRLHTDFGKKFICAKDVRTKRTVGKEHVLKHLDIIEVIAGR